MIKPQLGKKNHAVALSLLLSKWDWENNTKAKGTRGLG